MWALLAATPGVIMSNIDVGGNRAGTQTGYRAYGLSGQVRTSVEGINTTEGTGGAGFYYDYGSFEEVFLGVAGQGAEAATPGVQSNFLGKSGGNKFSGDFYSDFYNNSFQATNLTGKLVGMQVVLANGTPVWALMGNVDASNPRLTAHFRTLSVERGGTWFHLARYHDFDANERGPEQLATFLDLAVDDVFPISYDLLPHSKGDPKALRGTIQAKPSEVLTRDQIIALAVPRPALD